MKKFYTPYTEENLAFDKELTRKLIVRGGQINKELAVLEQVRLAQEKKDKEERLKKQQDLESKTKSDVKDDTSTNKITVDNSADNSDIDPYAKINKKYDEIEKLNAMRSQNKSSLQAYGPDGMPADMSETLTSVGRFFEKLFSTPDEEAIKKIGDTSKPTSNKSTFLKTDLKELNSDGTTKDLSNRHNLITNQYRSFGIGQITTRQSEIIGNINDRYEQLNEINKLPEYREFAALDTKVQSEGIDKLTNLERIKYADYKQNIDPRLANITLKKYAKNKPSDFGYMPSSFGAIPYTTQTKPKEDDQKIILQKEIDALQKDYENSIKELADAPKPDSWFLTRKSKTRIEKGSDLLKADNWLYFTPEMIGSSNSHGDLAAAQTGMVALSTAAPVIAKGLSKLGPWGKVGAVALYGTTAATNLWLNVESRTNESAANTGDAYKKKVTENLQKTTGYDFSNQENLTEYTDKFRKMYPNLANLPNEELLDRVLSFNTKDPVLEKVKDEARIGLTALYHKNNALGAFDIAEQAILLTGIAGVYEKASAPLIKLSSSTGKLINKMAKSSYVMLEEAAKTNKAAELMKTSVDATYEIGKFGKKAYSYTKGAITLPGDYYKYKALQSALTGSAAPSKFVKYGSATYNYLGKMAITSGLEATEELAQTDMEQDYLLDKFKYSGEDSIIKDAYDAYKSAAYSAAVFSNIIHDPILSNSKEFASSGWSGVMLNILQGGSMHAGAAALQGTVNYADSKYEKHKEQLVKSGIQDVIEANVRFDKDKIYAQRHMYNDQARLNRMFDDLENDIKNNPDSPMSIDELNKERERAKEIGSIVNTKSVQNIRKKLNDNDFAIYVGLLAKAVDDNKNHTENAKKASEINSNNVADISNKAYDKIKQLGLHIGQLREVTDEDKSISLDKITELQDKHKVTITKNEDGTYSAVGEKGKRDGISAKKRSENALSEINDIINLQVAEASKTGEVVDVESLREYTDVMLLSKALGTTIDTMSNLAVDNSAQVELLKKRKEHVDKVLSIYDKKLKNVRRFIEDEITKDHTDSSMDRIAADQVQSRSLMHFSGMMGINTKSGKLLDIDSQGNETIHESNLDYIKAILAQYKNAVVEDTEDVIKETDETQTNPEIEDGEEIAEVKEVKSEVETHVAEQIEQQQESKKQTITTSQSNSQSVINNILQNIFGLSNADKYGRNNIVEKDIQDAILKDKIQSLINKIKLKFSISDNIKANEIAERLINEFTPKAQPITHVEAISSPSKERSSENEQIVPEVDKSAGNAPQNASNDISSEQDTSDIVFTADYNEQPFIDASGDMTPELPDDIPYAGIPDEEFFDPSIGTTYDLPLSPEMEQRKAEFEDNQNKQIELEKPVEKVLTDYEKRELRKEELKKKISGMLRGTMSSGINVNILEPFFELSAMYIEDGYRKFVPWAKHVVETFGIECKIYLKFVYNHAVSNLEDKIGTDTEIDVAGIDIEELVKAILNGDIDEKRIELDAKNVQPNEVQLHSLANTIGAVDPYSHTLFYQDTNTTPMVVRETLSDGTVNDYKPMSGYDLSELSTEKDFISASNFHFGFSDEFKGHPILIIEYNGSNEKYKGKVFAAALRSEATLRKNLQNSNLTEDEINNAVAELNKFSSKIKALRGESIRTGKKIVPINNISEKGKITRTNGKFKTNTVNGKTKFRAPQEVKGLKLGDDLSKLEKTLFKIGFGGGVKKRFSIETNKGIVLNGGQSGTVYLFINPKELNNKDVENVPVSLNRRKFSHSDNYGSKEEQNALVDFITDLVVFKKSTLLENGLPGLVNFDKLELLNFIVNFGEHTGGALNNDNKQRTDKVFMVVDGKLLYGNNSKDLSELRNNPNVLEHLKNYIRDNFIWSADMDNCLSTDGLKKLKDVFPELKQFFDNNQKVNKITIIPNVLEFDREDLENPTVSWLFKHGKLLTDLHDDLFDSAFLYVNDVALEDDTVKPIRENEDKTPVIDTPEKIEVKDASTVVNANPKKRERPTVSNKKSNYGDTLLGTKGPNFSKKIKQIVNKTTAAFEQAEVMRLLGLSKEEVEIRDAVVMTLSDGTYIFGKMTEDAILLASELEKGTGYHEAFHRVSLLLLSPKQREQLYSDYRRVKGLPKSISNKQIEEFLAEEFREFMLTQEAPTKHYGIVKYYKKLLRAIQTFIGINNTTRDKIFADIRDGVYSNVNINKESLSEFRNSYKSGPNMIMENGTDITNIKNIGQLNDLVNSLTAITIIENGINSAQSIGDNIDFAKVKQKIIDLSNNPESDLQADNFELFDEIVEGTNFEEIFIPLIKNKLRDIQISIIDTEDQLLANMEDGKNLASWDIASNEVNPIHGILPDIKVLVATIPIVKVVDGNIVLDNSKHTDLPLLYDFKDSWNKLVKSLYGSNNAEDMLARLLEKASFDDSNESAFYKTVYNRINAKLSNTVDQNNKPISKEVRENYLTQFFITFKKHFATYIQYEYENTGSSKFVRNIVKLSFPNTKTQINKVTKQWFKNFSNHEGLWLDTKDGRVINKNTINVLVERYANMLADVQILSKEHIDELNRVDINNRLSQLKHDFIQILTDLGISDINEDVINNIIYERSIVDGKFKAGTSVDKFLNYLTQKIVVKGDKKPKPSITEFIGYLNNENQKYDNKLFFNAPITELASSLASIKNQGSLASPGPNGNMYFGVVENNTITDIINDISNNTEVLVDGAKQKIKTALNNTVFITGFNGLGSMFMNHINSNPKSKFKVVTYINYLQRRKGDSGKDFFELTAAEDFLLKMKYTQDDYMPFMTLADKKTYGAISADGFSLFHNIFDIYVEDGKVMRTLDNKVFSQFYNYIKAEFDCIVKKHVDSKSETEFDKIDNFEENGKYFRNFNIPLVLESGEHTTFNKMLKDGYANGNVEEVFSKLNDLFFRDLELSDSSTEEEIKEYNNSIKYRKSLIRDILKEQIDIDLKTAFDLKIISPQFDKNGNEIKGAPLNTQIDANVIDDITNRLVSLRIPGFDARKNAIYEAIAQYSVNTIVSSIEFQKIISKDPAYYKHKSDESKRLGGFNSTGSNSREDFPADHWINSEENTCKDGQYNVVELNDVKIKSNYVDDLYDLFYDAYVKDYTEQYKGKIFKSEEERQSVIHRDADISAKLQLNPYGKVNISDAAVLISPIMYKNLLMRFEGAWTTEVEEAFKIVEDSDAYLKSKELYAKSLGVILKPLKYVYMGDEFKNGTRIPIYNKMAIFPVFKAMAFAGDMKTIYDSMNNIEKPIHMYKFESATKLGGKSKVKLYNDNQANSINDLNNINEGKIYKEAFKYLRKQLVTDPHDVDRTLTGTQVIKAALGNIRLDSLYNNLLIAGKAVKGIDLRDQVMNCINALSKQGIDYIKTKFKITEDGENIIIDEKELSKVLIKDAIASNMSSDLIQSFKVENGKFKIPLNTISEAKWIEQKFISYISKEAIDIRMPGNAFIQQSAVAAHVMNLGSDTNVIGDTDYVLNNGNKLKFRREDNGATEASISINLFKPIMPKHILELSFIDQRNWLIKNNLIGDSSYPTAIGYRIPTQGQSSIDALQIMDVIPSNFADTIIMPYEFTGKNGSDFDVDKLFLFRYNYKINSNGDVVKVEFNDSLENPFENNSREAIENRLIDIYSALLRSDLHVHETRASIDTVTDALKGKGGVLETIENLLKKKEHTNTLFGLSATYNLNKKLENAVSKNGIGPFALNLVHHVLTQLYGCKVTNKTANKVLYNIDSISGHTGQDGVRILDWLSAMINAHVDAAKDPYITRLNIVPLTYNLTNFLLRAGKGSSVFYFMKQPIITELINYLDTNQVSFDTAVEEVRKSLKSKIVESVKSNITYMFDQSTLYKQLEDSTKNLTDKELAQYLANQEAILDSFVELNMLSNEMSEWVGVSQIDTKKFGNTLTHIRRYLYKYDKFKFDSTPTEYRKPIFSKVPEMLNGSFLDYKTNTVLPFIEKMFKEHLLSGSDLFVNIETQMFRDLNKLRKANDKLINSVYFGVSALIKSNHFNAEFGKSYYDMIKPMLYGTNSLANRLNIIKSDIYDGVYPELLDADGKIANTFIYSIHANKRQQDQHKNRPDLITVDISKDFGASSQFRLGWADLLNSENETLRTFAEDMVIYSFYNTADNPGINKIFNLVPQSKRLELKYNMLKDSMKRMNIPYTDIYKNMWKDNNIVPTVYSNKFETQYNIPIRIGGEMLYGNDSGYAIEIMIPQIFSLKDAVETGLNDDGEPLYTPFVKYTTDNNSFNGTFLYRFVGVKVTEDNQKIPVYALSEKKGFYDSSDGAFFTEYTNEPSAFPSNNLSGKDNGFITIGDVNNSSFFNKQEFNKVIGNSFIFYNLENRQVSEKIYDQDFELQFDSEETSSDMFITESGYMEIKNVNGKEYKFEFDNEGNMIDSDNFDSIEEAKEFYNKYIYGIDEDKRDKLENDLVKFTNMSALYEPGTEQYEYIIANIDRIKKQLDQLSNTKTEIKQQSTTISQETKEVLDKLGISEEEYNQLSKEEQERLLGCNK